MGKIGDKPRQSDTSSERTSAHEKHGKLEGYGKHEGHEGYEGHDQHEEKKGLAAKIKGVLHKE
jgi:hypothetical protein